MPHNPKCALKEYGRLDMERSYKKGSMESTEAREGRE